MFGIGEAIKELRGGRLVRRSGWNGKGMWLFLSGTFGVASIAQGQNSGWTMEPFVAIKGADNKVVPWLCSQTDLLAVDWECLPNECTAKPAE